MTITDDRYDVDNLIHMMKGGISPSTGGTYIGLEQRVATRVKDIFRIPVPQSFARNVRAKGDERDGSRIRGRDDTEADPRVLRDYLLTWLPESQIERNRINGRLPEAAPDRVTQEELSHLVKLANRHWFVLVGGRWGGTVSTSSIDAAVSLLESYMGWLGRACDHKRWKEIDGARVCLGCEVVEVA